MAETDDVEAVRLLLDAGTDPRRYRNDEDRPSSAVYEAVAAGCSAELVESLLAHGGDPNGRGDDDRTPYQRATSQGNRDLAELLHRYGASEDASDADRLLFACIQADRSEVERQLEQSPGLRAVMHEVLGDAVVRAAEADNSAAIALLLDLGFPVNGKAGEDGATALHAAAYGGSADNVGLLLSRGADIEAREKSWNSTPLVWAIVGSGEKAPAQPRRRLDRNRTNAARRWRSDARDHAFPGRPQTPECGGRPSSTGARRRQRTPRESSRGVVRARRRSKDRRRR